MPAGPLRITPISLMIRRLASEYSVVFRPVFPRPVSRPWPPLLQLATGPGRASPGRRRYRARPGEPSRPRPVAAGRPPVGPNQLPFQNQSPASAAVSTLATTNDHSQPPEAQRCVARQVPSRQKLEHPGAENGSSIASSVLPAPRSAPDTDRMPAKQRLKAMMRTNCVASWVTAAPPFRKR